MRVLALLALFVPSLASAAVPARLAASGALRNSTGAGVDGTYSITFALYATEAGPAAIFEEKHPNVVVSTGAFAVTLGETTALDADAAADAADLWLGVRVEGEPELPRQRLASVVWALGARRAYDLACTSCVTPEALSTAYAPLAEANTFAALQTFASGADFQAKEALLFRFQNAAAQPKPCDATTIGLAYFDTDKDRLQICGSKGWTAYMPIQPGSQFNPGLSCLDIHTNDPTLPSGSYWIQAGTLLKFMVHCDMTTDGGGWTEINLATARNVLGATMTAVIPAPISGIDAAHRPFTQDQDGGHSYRYDIPIPFGFHEFYLSKYQIRANAAPGAYTSDLDPAYPMTDWGTDFASCYGDVGFGTPSAVGPTTSLAANLSSAQTCATCDIDWPAGTKTYSVGAAVSTTFRIGWGESCGEWEGWYPWWSGSIFVR